MNDDELMSRAAELPSRFGPRLPDDHAAVLLRIEGGGEWDMLVTETIAALAKHKAPVTSAERDELRELAEATGEGGEYVAALTVR